MAVKPPSKLFIDSAALIALFNKSDRHHQEAVEYYNSLTKATKLYKTLLVVSETYTWFRYHLNYAVSAEFLEVINPFRVFGLAEIALPRSRDG
jgi:predicted nucleic acid-binding protein